MFGAMGTRNQLARGHRKRAAVDARLLAESAAPLYYTLSSMGCYAAGQLWILFGCVISATTGLTFVEVRRLRKGQEVK